MTDKKVLEVACAILISDSKVFIAQRADNQAMAGMWEFPGGKVEKGEKPEETVVRELFEELNMKVEVIEKLKRVTHHYNEFEIILHPFIVKHTQGGIIPKVHSNISFASIDELQSIELLDADVLILPQIIERLK